MDASADFLGGRDANMGSAVLESKSHLVLARHGFRLIRARAYGAGFNRRGDTLAVPRIVGIFPLSTCTGRTILVGDEFRIALDVLVGDRDCGECGTGVSMVEAGRIYLYGRKI